jgi:hypothetical protein
MKNTHIFASICVLCVTIVLSVILAQSADFNELNKNKDLYNKYLLARDTNILKKLANRAIDVRYGANASGYLEQLAGTMSGREMEITNIIIPSLLSASTNRTNPRAAILALDEYMDLYPMSVEISNSFLPQFYHYINENPFGESSKALVRIISRARRPDLNKIEVLRKLLQTPDNESTLRNSPLSSVRVQVVESIGKYLQTVPDLKVEVEKCLNDKNPFVVATAIFVLTQNGFTSELLCASFAQFLKTEEDPQYFLLMRLDELKSLPKCMFTSLNNAKNSDNRAISLLAEALVKKIDLK